MHFNQHCKTLMQPFYIVLTYISIRTRKKISAPVIKHAGPQRVRKFSNKVGLDPLKGCMNPETRCKPYKSPHYLLILPMLIHCRIIPYVITLPSYTLS